MTESPAGGGTAPRKTALDAKHRALGATMTDFAGWDMPLRYGSEREEHLAVRSRAGLFDLSHMGEITLTGPQAGALLDDGDLAPRPAATGPLTQMFGDAWEWTASPYVAYPGFQTAPGAVGEYNGKFMSGQFVLRGASCATARGHS